jgi:hypothetical protein
MAPTCTRLLAGTGGIAASLPEVESIGAFQSRADRHFIGNASLFDVGLVLGHYEVHAEVEHLRDLGLLDRQITVALPKLGSHG